MPASESPCSGFAAAPAGCTPLLHLHLLPPTDREMLSAPSPTRLSEAGLLRRRFKGHRSSKKTSVHAYSDYGEPDTDGGVDGPSGGSSLVVSQAAAAAAAAAMGPRSVSLTALHPSAGGTRSGRISAGGVPLLEPRMAQLETLEAKMASIEVSLSSSSLGPGGTSTRRTKRTAPSPVSILSRVASPTSPAVSSTSLLNLSRASPVPPSTPQPTPTPQSMERTPPLISPVGNKEAAAAAAASRELEALRNALRDKENVIHSLRSQLSSSMTSWRQSSSVSSQLQPALGEKERRAIEERLSRVRQDMETKRLAIKNLKMALERLDITDNIDVRIQQAEAEFQLGREELALLALVEENRTLAARLEEAAPHLPPPPACTLYSVLSAAISSPQQLQGVLLNVTLTLDPSNPSFGITRRSETPSTPSVPVIEWAANSSGLHSGDRLLEANGRLLLGYHQDELSSILGSNAPSLRLVVLRVTPVPKPTPAPPPDTATLILKEATALREELAAARGRLAEQSPESEKIKKERDTLKHENLRLFHRISYLEEQVSDLAKDNRSISSHGSPSIKSNGPPPEVHVFQKGSHVTTIVTNLQESGRLSRKSEAPPSRSQTPRWHGGEESEGGCSDGRSTRSLDVLHKIRPAPPKKPQRLSLPRTTSLQQVDGLPLSEAPRKPSKRSHKGSNVVEAPPKPEPSAATLRWSNPAPNCALPTSAQYHNHNQHILNFRRNNVSVGDEKWC